MPIDIVTFVGPGTLYHGAAKFTNLAVEDSIRVGGLVEISEILGLRYNCYGVRYLENESDKILAVVARTDEISSPQTTLSVVQKKEDGEFTQIRGDIDALPIPYFSRAAAVDLVAKLRLMPGLDSIPHMRVLYVGPHFFP